MHNSFHFIPADNKNYLEKLNTVKADVIILDLEDSVSDKSKSIARENIDSYYNTKLEIYVRINELNSSHFEDDIHLIKNLPKNVGLIIPKLSSSIEINHFVKKIGREIKIIPLIESFMTLNNCDQFLNHKMIVAVGLGTEDMLVEVPYSNESLNLLTENVRIELLKKALAYNILPIDVISSNISDLIGFESDCTKARQMGYTAKFSIHPKQIDIINKVLSPNSKEIEWADTIVSHEPNENSGYIMHNDGVLTTPPKIKKAIKIKNYEK
jgi:citrate lyase subunit beta/citryl-CoA lyase